MTGAEAPAERRTTTARWAAWAAAAERYGTPVYVYDPAEIRRRARLVRTAFDHRVAVLYAVKANPFGPLLSTLRDEVDGLDVASTGEIQAALDAGYATDQLRIAGPAKSAALLAWAVDHRTVVSVESPEELEALAALAEEHADRRRPMPVALRLEPREPRRAFAVPMGVPSHPFGLDAAEARRALAVLRRHPEALALTGVHVYGGSQCRSVRGWLGHLAHVLDLAVEVQQTGWTLGEINVGGGFGVASRLGPELDVAALGPRALRMMAKLPGPRFVVELGRYLVADAGVYLCRVVRTKVRGSTRTAFLDGGVHHLWAATGQLGPEPHAVTTRPADGTTTHLVGPLCTPLDQLGAVNATLHPGDLVGFTGVGAYGLTLSPSRFLGHPPPAEALLTDRRPAPAER